MAGRRRVIGAAWGALLLAAAVFADSRGDLLQTFLTLDRRALAAEARHLSEASRRLESAIGELTAASRSVSEAAAKDDATLSQAAETLSRAAGAVQSASLEQRLSIERISLLRRRVSELEREAAAGRAGRSDPISGDWHVRIDPGSQEGDLHLSLEGTLLGGTYALEGGMSGSVRGTVVGDRLRFERIDSRLGFSAVFYGRLLPDGTTVTGTWEATELNNAGPTSGTWSAVKKAEPEEP